MKDFRSFAGLMLALPAFLRQTVTLDEARAALRRRLDERGANFLEFAERSIFQHPASPYLPLLARAGCQFVDLQQMVRTRGLEPTLSALREQGVFIPFEEFKRRAASFWNPQARHHLRTETSGSTGKSTPATTGLPRIGDLALYLAVAWDAYGLTGKPKAMWRGPLPDGSGISFLLASARLRDMPAAWFTPVVHEDLTSSVKFPLATNAVVAMARACGVRMPHPVPVDLDRADIVARWAANAVRSAGRCYISASASMSLRVCLAAKAEGLDLTGAVFSGGGEPMTAAKANGIAHVGAKVRQNYFSVDTGVMGMSCAQPAGVTEQHLFTDSVAFIQHSRQVPGSGLVVDAFNVTTLLPWSQKVLLNVELDDYGIIDERQCGCPFEALGFTQHVRQIASFRKLTGEGVTLIGTDVVRILEEVLPGMFGGTPLDYQLSEEESAEGFTRVNLIVSPRVQVADEAAVRDVFLDALARANAGADHGRAIWQKAGTLRVVRAEPVWTGRGKLMPLQLAQRARRDGHAEAALDDSGQY